jgi:hypothetical protein
MTFVGIGFCVSYPTKEVRPPKCNSIPPQIKMQGAGQRPTCCRDLTSLIPQDQHNRLRLKEIGCQTARAAREGAACRRRALEERLTDLQPDRRFRTAMGSVRSFQGRRQSLRTVIP